MGESTLIDIGNKLGRYLDTAEPKGGQYRCARICVEVNLKKGLPEALKLTLGEWSHIQELDYEQIPFKCNFCHVYVHFTKSCPKLAEPQKPANPPATTDTEFQTVFNRRRPPRRKEPQASQQKVSQDHSPLADTPRPENKNSFEVLQEDEAQEPKVVDVPDQGLPGPLGSLEATE